MTKVDTSQAHQQYRSVLLIGAVAALGLCQSAACAPFVQMLQEQYRASGLPGLCVAAVDARGIRFSAGLGLADLDRGVAYTVDTAQPVGSVSKTFIGLALADLASRGDLDLDASVLLPGTGGATSSSKAQTLVNPSYAGQAITWRQLATHTSRILDEGLAYEAAYVPGREAATSMSTFIQNYLYPATPKALQARFALTAPGQSYAYSNVGAAAAAVALERQIGIPFDSYTQ